MSPTELRDRLQIIAYESRQIVKSQSQTLAVEVLAASVAFIAEYLDQQLTNKENQCLLTPQTPSP